MRNLSLFTGSGIGDLAAKMAGIETVAQCESDPVCQFALRKLWPEAYLYEDVKHVSAESLRERGLWPIDIISGGFPCQDISTAGRGAGIEGSRSGLWGQMFRVIRQVRPAWLLIENVPVLRVRGADRVIAPLERIGYTCWPLVAGAWAVGAPHKRDRVWIIGRRVDHAVSGGHAECDRGIATKPNSDRAQDGLPDSASECSECFGTGWTGGNPDFGECSCRLADAISGNCRSGRDEQERGSQGGTAAGRAGATTVADATPGGLGTDGSPCGDTGHADQRDEGMGNAKSESDRRVRDLRGGDGGGGKVQSGRDGTAGVGLADSQESGREGAEPARSTCAAGCLAECRWPSRPGEPQHDWEAPRLTERGVGCEPDGVPSRVHSRANKALLRILGNAWVYPLPVLIYRWMVAQSATGGAENKGG